MKRWLWYAAGAAVAVGGVALLSKRSGPPLNPVERVQGMPLGGASTVKGYYDSIAALQGFGPNVHTQPNALTQKVWTAQKAEFERRQRDVMRWLATLPEAEAKKAFGGAAPDDHSKQSFLIYRPGHFQTGAFGPEQWGWYLTDEYGRPFEGWGYGGSPGAVVLPIVQNVLPLIPGIGTAGGAALGAAIAVGQGKSLKDIGIAAARGALPPYATMAFDTGVAIASGHPLSDVAVQAAMVELEKRYPGSRQAFADGKTLYTKAKT